MIKGETVTLFRPIVTEDAFGEVIEEFDEGEVMDNVLVAPSSTADLEAARVFGKTATLTLHMPKGFTGNLKNCKFEVRGNEYRVIGNPTYYTLENTPTQWWYPVSVEKVDG